MIKKFVTIGPESTGKTTISEQLAGVYNTGWCQEYAREYLLNNGPKYSYDDLLIIAKGQLAIEDSMTMALEKKHPDGTGLLFLDTDLTVLKVWCEYVYGKCHSFILDQIACRKYDFYFLCNTDFPWQEDILREYPEVEQREELFKMYKDLLVNQATPWMVLEGDPDQRINLATKAVNALLKT